MAGFPIGRVYRVNSIQSGGWFYTMNGTYRNRCGSISGQVVDRDEALIGSKRHGTR